MRRKDKTKCSFKSQFQSLRLYKRFFIDLFLFPLFWLEELILNLISYQTYVCIQLYIKWRKLLVQIHCTCIQGINIPPAFADWSISEVCVSTISEHRKGQFGSIELYSDIAYIGFEHLLNKQYFNIKLEQMSLKQWKGRWKRIRFTHLYQGNLKPCNTQTYSALHKLIRVYCLIYTHLYFNIKELIIGLKK